jgi:hypothetical protein
VMDRMLTLDEVDDLRDLTSLLACTPGA